MTDAEATEATTHTAMKMIDPYSMASLPIEMFFGKTLISSGTGFIWEDSGQFYLVTNWHNVSGKDPNTGQHLSSTAAEPDRVQIFWNRAGDIGVKRATIVRLTDEHGPLWLVHPKLRQTVDVVALKVSIPAGAEPYPINLLHGMPLRLEIGQDVFVLGFPYGVSLGGMPIWKRGSIATEPQLMDAARPCVLVDTASRPGMSGSPVIRRVWGTAILEDGGLKLGVIATKFFGVYSGRLQSADPLAAHLGIVWPAELVTEIVTAGVQDR